MVARASIYTSIRNHETHNKERNSAVNDNQMWAGDKSMLLAAWVITETELQIVTNMMMFAVTKVGKPKSIIEGIPWTKLEMSKARLYQQHRPPQSSCPCSPPSQQPPELSLLQNNCTTQSEWFPTDSFISQTVRQDKNPRWWRKLGSIYMWFFHGGRS